MGNGIISRVRSFIARPLNTQGDLVNWTLFLIFAITVAILWTRVLKHISE